MLIDYRLLYCLIFTTVKKSSFLLLYCKLYIKRSHFYAYSLHAKYFTLATSNRPNCYTAIKLNSFQTKEALKGLAVL